MKKILPFLSLLLVVFTFSCSKKDGTNLQSDGTFDGKYKGQTFYNNAPLGTWEMDIKNSKISGTYIQAGETASIKGTIAESGKLNISIDNDGEKITVDAVVANGTITGTWSNEEDMSGTLSGEKVADGDNNQFVYDGSYSGTATLNGTNAATWSIAIVKHKVSGIFNDQTGSGSAFITGVTGANGEITIEIVYDNGSVVNAALQINNDDVSGTWSADGDSGDMNGKKDEKSASNNYDGSYEGQAFMDGDNIGSWTMTIQDNIATGSYSGGDEGSGSVKGVVTATGGVIFNAYEEEDFIVNVKAFITGNNVNGTWSNNEGESGTLTGSKK